MKAGFLGGMTTAIRQKRRFSPKKMKNLVAWFDAKDKQSLVVSKNSNIQTWRDKSGNGFNLTQSVAAKKPKLLEVEGRSVVEFTGDKTFTIPNKLPKDNIKVYTFQDGKIVEGAKLTLSGHITQIIVVSDDANNEKIKGYLVKGK